MTGAVLTITAGGRERQVRLSSYLEPSLDESASTQAAAWIKGLRNARVDGVPLRRRFTVRDDSLWWFAELYLHKQQAMLQVFRTLEALQALVQAEQPTRIVVAHGSRVVRVVTPRFAASRGMQGGAQTRIATSLRLAAMDARASWLHATALASRIRRRPAGPTGAGGSPVLAFVHRAFWRGGEDEDGAEQYIGPVLSALADRLPEGSLEYVSVGPARNFRARRWWHSSSGQPEAVERFASLGRLAPSRGIWSQRHTFRRALWRSDDLREMSQIGGIDCWPVVREELAGIALLQWPWSARAMDEAGAALDALTPSAVLTYAEAGGWGRAIILECRRRGIPTAGLQHGFIYRHWLNYRHEPDEMVPDPDQPADLGFPRPSLTLLFDSYAATHLAEAGHFPSEALEVTGSARLDELVRHAAALAPADLQAARAAAGAGPGEALVLVATKCREAAHALPSLLAAAGRIPGIHVVIKTHPAETDDVYAELVQGLPHVSILPASAPLAPLIRASRAVVTVNSTVALDAAVLGVPTLVIGLPNNLSPFVDAGLMAGAPSGNPAEILRRILYDERFRGELEGVRQELLSRFHMRPDGGAAGRAADAVLRLAGGSALRHRGAPPGECD